MIIDIKKSVFRKVSLYYGMNFELFITWAF